MPRSHFAAINFDDVLKRRSWLTEPIEKKPQPTVIGRSCIGYAAELAQTVDFNKPITAVAINHNTRVVTLGNEHAKAP